VKIQRKAAKEAKKETLLLVRIRVVFDKSDSARSALKRTQPKRMAFGDFFLQK